MQIYDFKVSHTELNKKLDIIKSKFGNVESELAEISLLNNEFKAFCEKTTEIYRNSEIFKINDIFIEKFANT